MLPRGTASTRSRLAASVRPDALKLRTEITLRPAARRPPVQVCCVAATRAPRAPTLTRVTTAPVGGRVNDTTSGVRAGTTVEMGATIVSGPAWCWRDALTGATGFAVAVACWIRFPT